MSNIWKSLIIVLLGLIVGCGSGNKRQKVQLPPAPPITGEVKINSTIPYSADSFVAAKIKNECTIGTQLSEFVASASEGNNVKVSRVSNLSNKDTGQVLDIKITNAVSQGNAFLGHRKYTQISGTFYVDGMKKSTFKGGRNSMGGAFAGFKGSCSVLGRTVEALGSDIAKWFANPQDGVGIGDI